MWVAVADEALRVQSPVLVLDAKDCSLLLLFSLQFSWEGGLLSLLAQTHALFRFLPWFKSAIPFQELDSGWGKGEDIFILVSAHIFRKRVSQANMRRSVDFRNIFGFQPNEAVFITYFMETHFPMQKFS